MSNQFHTPRIVQPGSRSPIWLWLWLLVAVVLGVIAWKIFDYGRHQGGFDSRARDTQVELLEERISALQKERDQLRLDAAKFERAAQIDESAVSTVQAELEGLEENNAALQQQVDFLKSLLSGDISMLQLNDLELSKQEGGNSYRYAFTLSKRTKDKQKVRGQVKLSVAGQLKGKAKELGGGELGIGKGLKMGFSHFQKFEGELKLPVGFIPRELRVKVKPGGKKIKSFEQSFEWRVSES